MNGIKIGKEDFLKADPETRDGMLYEMLADIHRQVHLKRTAVIGGIAGVLGGTSVLLCVSSPDLVKIIFRILL